MGVKEGVNRVIAGWLVCGMAAGACWFTLEGCLELIGLERLFGRVSTQLGLHMSTHGVVFVVQYLGLEEPSKYQEGHGWEPCTMSGRYLGFAQPSKSNKPWRSGVLQFQNQRDN